MARPLNKTIKKFGGSELLEAFEVGGQLALPLAVKLRTHLKWCHIKQLAPSKEQFAERRHAWLLWDRFAPEVKIAALSKLIEEQNERTGTKSAD